jgi:ribosomal protein S18 acetylase RimI-like enzyme
MDIRTASPDDADGIAAVHVRSWQAAYADILDPAWLAALSVEHRARGWRAALADPASRTAVTQHGGQITGFVSLGACRDAGAPASQGEVMALYAAPEVWGQGHGLALLDHALALLQADGFRAVSLWVLAGNQRALRFYMAAGFQPIAGSEKVFALGGRQVAEVACLRPLPG